MEIHGCNFTGVGSSDVKTGLGGVALILGNLSSTKYLTWTNLHYHKLSGGRLNVTNSQFLGSWPSITGGIFFILNSNEVYVSRSIFRDNKAGRDYGGGGSIFMLNSSGFFADIIAEGNSAQNGGWLGINGGYNHSSLHETDNIDNIIECLSSSEVSACIHIDSKSIKTHTISLRNLICRGNDVNRFGGCISLELIHEFSCSNCSFVTNTCKNENEQIRVSMNKL